MKQFCLIVVLALPFSVLGCNSSAGDEGTAMAVGAESAPQTALPEMDEDRDLAPAQIPEIVRKAALAAVPGLLIELAELEGNGVYCVHGTADGMFTEIEVGEDGRVIDIEQGDDDDDDGNDDGDGDDDEDDEGEDDD